jgi:transcriptional regulator with XRE-family HTH domain
MYSINKRFLSEILRVHTPKAGGIRPICKLLKISSSSYYNYINELTTPDMSFLESLAELTRTPLQSFFNEMTRAEEIETVSDDPYLAKIAKIFSIVDESHKKMIVEYAIDVNHFFDSHKLDVAKPVFKKKKA